MTDSTKIKVETLYHKLQVIQKMMDDAEDREHRQVTDRWRLPRMLLSEVSEKILQLNVKEIPAHEVKNEA